MGPTFSQPSQNSSHSSLEGEEEGKWSDLCPIRRDCMTRRRMQNLGPVTTTLRSPAPCLASIIGSKDRHVRYANA